MQFKLMLCHLLDLMLCHLFILQVFIAKKSMQCRFCKFFSLHQDILFKHYRTCHWSVNATSFSCLHPECVCIFKTIGALKTHLWREHRKTGSKNATFSCDNCDFKDICSQSEFLQHLRGHLKNHERVHCPFSNCNFITNSNIKFKAHKSRKHKSHGLNDFRTSYCAENRCNDPDPAPSIECVPNLEEEVEVHTSDLNPAVSKKSLEHKLAALFLSMQTQLHVSKRACQRIINEISDILTISKSNTLSVVKEILESHNCDVDQSVVTEIAHALHATDPFLTACSNRGILSTDHKRMRYFNQEFQVIEPVEYVFSRADKHTFFLCSPSESSADIA